MADLEKYGAKLLAFGPAQFTAQTVLASLPGAGDRNLVVVFRNF